MTHRSNISRRTFVKQAAAGSLALAAAPAIVTASKTDSATDVGKHVIGAGDHRYECDHHWAQLPDKYAWQTTHNVAVDSGGLVYVIHEGRLDQPDHPAIFVFDADGKFVRAFGSQFQGGGHGLEARQEGSDEFLYVTAYQSKRSFAKLTLDGETVWHKYAPMEAGIYAKGEDIQPRSDSPWGNDRFLPTNFAFHPDGGFYLADGYGGWCIHRYDADGNWLSKFGKPSDDKKADGSFHTPHGLWLDNRPEPQASSSERKTSAPEPETSAPGDPRIIVTDRANARLQWFTPDGQHLRTQEGFLLPANADVRGDLLLIPDLVGRVFLLDGNNEVVAQLGDDHERMAAEGGKKVIRGDESKWRPGKFVHPHDACFDAEGNIYVAEWVQRGRISKLCKLA
jgi:hypothetical protein